MARWWDTQMASASQALYKDPATAVDAANVPDAAFGGPLSQEKYTKKDYEKDQESTQKKRSGFLGAILNFGDAADDVANSVSGGVWDKVQDNVLAPVGKAAWYPVDKLATGAHWLYSNAVSRPLSTLLQMDAQAALEGDPTKMFDGSAWGNAWDAAEHISPGQVVGNAVLTAAAKDKLPTGLLDPFGNIGLGKAQDVIKQDKELKDRNTTRMIQDTDYWRDKGGWGYTMGTGALDFVSVMALDPSTYLTGGVSNAVKGLRSVKYVERGGELVRDQGTVVNTAKKLAGKAPQTPEDVSRGKKLQDFFDWTQEAGANGAARKTQAEIAQHPIFSGGARRGNPARQQLASLFANTAREDMPLVYRYAAGDTAAASDLMAKGGSVVDDIGRISENRKLVDSVNLEPEILAYFASKEGAKVAEGVTPRLAPRSDLSNEALRLHEEAAKAVVSGGTKFKINVGGTVSKRFAKEADQWKADKLSMIDGELTRAGGIGETLRVALGSNLGKEADDFSTAVQGAHLFGGLPNAYRMGEGAFRDVSRAAEKKFGRQMADRKGVFSTEGIRKGFFGTPVRVLQSFGDRTPIGRINHNDADAGDRVLDMLKQAPGLGPDMRASLLNKYLTAGDKTAKSRALNEIHTTVLDHMAQSVHGMSPELSNIMTGLVKAGTESTINKLLSKTVGSAKYGTTQKFSSALAEGEARSVDMVEDGIGWAASPLAKTQLSQTDSLLPIREINRVFGRNSGSLQKLHSMGGSALDVARIGADSFNTIWKASTLLRPAYTARMVSEEVAAAAIKFGFMSHIVGGGTPGAKNFVLNRAQSVKAELGLGSYAPSTGAGVDSNLAVVRLGDDEVIAAANARKAGIEEEIATHEALPKNPLRVGEIKTQLKGLKNQKQRKALKDELKTYHDQAKLDRLKAEHGAIKVKRIRVNKALPVIDARIKMESELHGGLQKDLARYTKEHQAQQTKVSQAGTEATTRQLRKLDELELRVSGITDEIADHAAVIDEFQQYSNHILQTAANSVGRRVGEGTFQHRGMAIPQAFSKDWANPIQRAQFDAEGDAAAGAVFSRAEAVDKERMIKSGNWTSIEPDAPNHMDAWLRAVNHQFGQDEGFRLAMEDSTGAKLTEFLKTPAGKQHLADIGTQGKDPEQLVKSIQLTLDKYLPEGTGLRQKLLNGEDVTRADLHAKIPPAQFPVVHGEEVLDKTSLWGKTTSGHIVDTAVRKGFNRLGQIPQSVMSRNPVYVRFQEGRMKELIDQEIRVRNAAGKPNSFTKEELENLRNQSDKLARKDLTKIVYDPMRTSASESLRFIAPFFSAHADGLTRWAGLIAEKPQALGRIAQIYNAPVAANMITDAQGNAVGIDGYAEIHDPSTGKVVDRKFVPIQERTLQLRAPWAEAGKGSIPIKLQAINTILPGDPWWNPGSGPIVQIAGSQIAKASPTTGDFLQWSKILPYGPSGSVSDAVLPKYMRAMWDAYKGDDPDNEEYQKAYLAIWNKKQQEFHENGTKFSTKDIEDEAKNFLMLNVLEAWGSPAQTSSTPLTGTPYQFFVDQLAQMRKVDPEHASDNFLAKFGSDYAGFTATLSKGMGIAATISADQQAEKYKDEISADPDMAAFWVGDVYNGGPFSSTVYTKQLDQNFGAEKAREKIPAEHAIENSQVSTGWSEYKKTKLRLDSLLLRNGFKSYGQKGAEEFNQAKKDLVTGISTAYPAWGEEFSVTDRGRVPARIQSFTRALSDEKLTNDPTRRELPALAEYLRVRAALKGKLKERGLSQLSYSVDDAGTAGREATGQASDIGQAWEQFRMGLANSNIAFNELMNRYLSNDDLQ
jgi:hypothetical protein